MFFLSEVSDNKLEAFLIYLNINNFNMMKTLTSSVVFFLFSVLCFTSNAQVYEYEFTAPANIDRDGYARYKIYIPESVEKVRGIYCYVPGWQGSSLGMINNIEYQKYVEEKGFAFMCFNMVGSYTNYYQGVTLWSGDALVQALTKLSEISGHPELKYSAMLFNGHSAGGQFAYHFTQYKPERVIAFVTIKGGYHSLSSAGSAVNVPGYMFIGENDESHRIDNLSGIFKTNRKYNALWCLAMEPNAGHGRVDEAIIHSYFDEIIPLRLPDIIPLNNFPVLKSVQQQKGWLGNPDTHSISSFDEYGNSKKSACWFPSEKIAKEWQLFSEGNFTLNTNVIEDKKLNVYPNPAKGSINISLKNNNVSNARFQIISSLGQTVKEGKLVTNSIPVNDLAKGAYIVRIHLKDQLSARKILIE